DSTHSGGRRCDRHRNDLRRLGLGSIRETISIWCRKVSAPRARGRDATKCCPRKHFSTRASCTPRPPAGCDADAMADAAASNVEFDAVGLPRTNADKRRAVNLMWTAMGKPGKGSYSEIARRVGVDHKFVGNLIKEWSNHAWDSPKRGTQTSASPSS